MLNKLIINTNQYTKYKIPFPLVDIFLFKWKPNVESKIHDHSKSGCVMLLLNGCLYEKIYSRNLKFKKEKKYNQLLNISYINDCIGYHKITNKCNNYTYSLHFYHPKNHKTKYFNK